MGGDIPPCGPALGSHVIEGCMAQHFSLLCCLLSLPAAVHHALRSLTHPVHSKEGASAFRKASEGPMKIQSLKSPKLYLPLFVC